MAVGQNQWYHFGVDPPPILVYFSGDCDVYWGYDLAFDPWPYCIVLQAVNMLLSDARLAPCLAGPSLTAS